MPIEIDSSDIIAYLACKDAKYNRITIQYDEIRYLGYQVEKISSHVLATCDIISIDAFRCQFPEYVKMEATYLEIDNISDILGLLHRLQPTDEVVQILEDIYEKNS